MWRTSQIRSCHRLAIWGRIGDNSRRRAPPAKSSRQGAGTGWTRKLKTKQRKSRKLKNTDRAKKWRTNESSEKMHAYTMTALYTSDQEDHQGRASNLLEAIRTHCHTTPPQIVEEAEHAPIAWIPYLRDVLATHTHLSEEYDSQTALHIIY